MQEEKQNHCITHLPYSIFGKTCNVWVTPVAFYCQNITHKIWIFNKPAVHIPHIKIVLINVLKSDGSYEMWKDKFRYPGVLNWDIFRLLFIATNRSIKTARLKAHLQTLLLYNTFFIACILIKQQTFDFFF